MSIKQTDVETTYLYDGTVQVNFREKGHKYTVVVDGVKTKPPSVTRITETLNKPQIIPWAIDQTLSACRECIKPDTSYSLSELEQIFAAARKQAQTKKEEAAGIGTAAHDWIHEHLSGRQPEMPALDAPHRPCVDAVLDFFLTHDVRVLHTERPIYSKLYGFSGRKDLTAWVDGKKTLVDYKTGNSIYWESRLQTAAYNQAEFEEFGELHEQRLILRLGKFDGQFYKAFYSAEDQEPDFKAFLGLREAFLRVDALALGCERCSERSQDRRKRCENCKRLVCKACLGEKWCKSCEWDPLEG